MQIRQKALKAEKETVGRAGEKISIRAQLEAAKEQAPKKKQARDRKHRVWKKGLTYEVTKRV